MIAAPLAVIVVSSLLPVLLFLGMESCTPPSAAQLDRQRMFVLAHLPDARRLDVGHQDCDDDGRGYVEFATRLTPAEAADRFLADPACSVAVDTYGSDAAIDCRSDEVAVFISLDTAKAGTDGYLDMPPL